MLNALKENTEAICKFMREPCSGEVGKYHCSWDWLMPVLVEIDRLEDVHGINITPHTIIIFLNHGDEEIFVERQPEEELLDSMYRIIVKFVKLQQ